jgi:hypothetical protein
MTSIYYYLYLIPFFYARCPCLTSLLPERFRAPKPQENHPDNLPVSYACQPADKGNLPNCFQIVFNTMRLSSKNQVSSLRYILLNALPQMLE